MTTSSYNPRIGYLVSQYPAPSHTFIRREVSALRKARLDVRTYSVRPPPPGLDSRLDREAEAGTFFILRQSLSAIVRANLGELARRPPRYVRTFMLALRHRAPGLRALLLAAAHFVEAIALARRLRQDGVTHLHNHFANAGATVGLLASHFLGLPWSLTLHSISETDYPAGLLLADKISRARFVACVSRFGMAQAMRITPPSEWSKFSIVRCGIDLSELPHAAAGPGPTNIICVGRLSSEKGHAGLLDAFAALRARGVDAILALVGDGPEHDGLVEQVGRSGLDGHVRFLGRLDEKVTLAAIAAADMLVLPSFMEGLPVVLIEAMALGKPVVASRVAGVPELVTDGESGLLFTPADWSGLTDAMERLAADPIVRRVLGAAGRARVEGEFAIERAVAPLPRLFGRQSAASLFAPPAQPFSTASAANASKSRASLKSR